ncbi:Terminal uridylyltransferase 7 (TUTase 7) (Zinc finger CCHC domain-containing protein 6) [Durusdinium trenchii]|uniref:Terminal uridylyltransferase 7 (TUTase 7) (Zinc finger CCHC domain-containing protein 6) n=1 Tax=Durusdinium trenchii TaxID=1381693 RepID=A0ABP0IWZ3_9DINO
MPASNLDMHLELGSQQPLILGEEKDCEHGNVSLQKLSGYVMQGKQDIARLPTLTYSAKVNAIIKCILSAAEDVRGVEVRAFGSSANGFGDDSSDVDVVLAATRASLVKTLDLPSCPERDLAPRVLRKLEKKLREQGFRILERILGARVPILKMSLRFQGQDVECDLSVNNLLPVFNTKLLRTYAEINPHVVGLVQACKEWAKEYGVHGAARGHLSSYSFTLMVIFFLQIRRDLPCLQESVPPEWYGENGEIYNVAMDTSADFSKYAERSRPHLEDFVRFYRDEFLWGEWVVSIRKGKCLSHKSYPQLKKQPRTGVTRSEIRYLIHIEDPFDISRNLHCVLGPGRNEQLWDAFMSTPAPQRRWHRSR